MLDTTLFPCTYIWQRLLAVALLQDVSHNCSVQALTGSNLSTACDGCFMIQKLEC